MNTVKPDRHSSSPWPVALAALACLFGATPVLAEAPMETRSVAVHYADLDLGSAAGAGTLYHRIQGAARMVCGYPDHSLATLAQVRSCNDGAIADAVTSVDAPLLSAIHSAHRGGTVTAVFND